MSKILHVADLHLTARDEREYSLSVLDEILAKAQEVGADHILVCGDLFDSFDDAMELRAEVRERIAAVGGPRILFVPGNHDVLRIGPRSIGRLDLGNMQICCGVPFEMVYDDEVEFLCIPHQTSHAGYQEWNVPPKERPFRVALLHGLVSGIGIYFGPEVEEANQGGAIDPDLFVRFEVDYGALGHLHGKRGARIGNTHVQYPGSARVWRRGEGAERGIYLVNTKPELSLRFIPLQSAGQYREFDPPLGLDGSIDSIDSLAEGWGCPDWVRLRLSGIVEDENAVAKLESAIRAKHEGRVRRLEINRDAVRPLPGIASQPMARKFLARWKAKESSAGQSEETKQAWLKARELGLGKIAAVLEAREC